MNEPRNISMNRAHLDQMRSYLDEALAEIAPLYADAANRGASDDLRQLERIQYYIVSARDNLPPKQMALPF